MKSLILIIKGFFIGIAKIIPGVSGALLAITFNLYEEGLNAITNFFDNPKKNLFFLLKVGFGIILGIIIFSKVITYFFKYYYFLTMFFFIGLIGGGIIPIIKKNKSKNYPIILISFIIIYLISTLTGNNNINIENNFTKILIFSISGLIDAASTVIPGISGTALLLLIGTYNQIITLISNITNIEIIISNLEIFLPYTINLFLGLIIFTKLMHYLFKKKREKTISFIIGISLSTLLILIIKTLNTPHQNTILIPAIILLIIGYIIGKNLDN